VAKDKPWTKKEKQTFIQLVSKGKAVDVISQALDKSEDDVFIKLRRLGLEVVVGEKNQPTTTSRSDLPKLPSVENVMKRSSAAQ